MRAEPFPLQDEDGALARRPPPLHDFYSSLPGLRVVGTMKISLWHRNEDVAVKGTHDVYCRHQSEAFEGPGSTRFTSPEAPLGPEFDGVNSK